MGCLANGSSAVRSEVVVGEGSGTAAGVVTADWASFGDDVEAVVVVGKLDPRLVGSESFAA